MKRKEKRNPTQYRHAMHLMCTKTRRGLSNKNKTVWEYLLCSSSNTRKKLSTNTDILSFYKRVAYDQQKHTTTYHKITSTNKQSLFINSKKQHSNEYQQKHKTKLPMKYCGDVKEWMHVYGEHLNISWSLQRCSCFSLEKAEVNRQHIRHLLSSPLHLANHMQPLASQCVVP